MTPLRGYNLGMRPITLLALACLLPGLTGCSDGCGEAPKESSSSGPSSGGGASGASTGGGGGGANVELDRKAPGAPQTLKDAKQQAGPQGPAASAGSGVAVSSEPAPAPVKTEALPTGPSLADVDASDFAELVTGSPGLVLLVAHDPSVEESKDVFPIFEGLSQEWAPKVAVRRLNVGLPGLAKLLPGLAAKPVPSFALYRDGKLISRRQGPPFQARRGKGGEPLESVPVYLERLKIWLREAVRARTLRR